MTTRSIAHLLAAALLAAALLAAALPAGAARLQVAADGPDLVFTWDTGRDDLLRGTAPDALGPWLPGVSSPVRVPGENALRGEDAYYALASGSNMAFRIERSYPSVIGPGGPFLNLYYVSLPLDGGAPDVADSGAVGTKCVGDIGGPSAPDGSIDAFDVLCLLWADRESGVESSMVVSRFDRDECRWESAFGNWSSFGGVSFGGRAFPIDLEEGLLVNVAVPLGGLPVENHTTLVGAHDPDWIGREIRAPASGCVPSNDLVAMPYHVVYRESAEILCGQREVEWIEGTIPGIPQNCWRESDQDGDGLPDFNGIQDPGEGASGIFSPFDGSGITVLIFDNEADGEGNDNGYLGQGVCVCFELSFTAPSFALRPGDGYLVNLARNHWPTLWLPPHH